MSLKDLIYEFKEFTEELLLPGLAFLPSSSIKDLKKFQLKFKKYNLIYGEKLIYDFLESDKRAQEYLNISIWLDTFIIEMES